MKKFISIIIISLTIFSLLILTSCTSNSSNKQFVTLNDLGTNTNSKGSWIVNTDTISFIRPLSSENSKYFEVYCTNSVNGRLFKISYEDGMKLIKDLGIELSDELVWD